MRKGLSPPVRHKFHHRRPPLHQSRRLVSRINESMRAVSFVLALHDLLISVQVFREAALAALNLRHKKSMVTPFFAILINGWCGWLA